MTLYLYLRLHFYATTYDVTAQLCRDVMTGLLITVRYCVDIVFTSLNNVSDRHSCGVTSRHSCAVTS